MTTSEPSTPLPNVLDLVIFGGVGDLSVRKLLPALYTAHLHHNLPAATRIHCLGRQPWDQAAFLAFIQDKVAGFAEPKAQDAEAWQSFLQRLNYVSIDATQASAVSSANTRAFSLASSTAASSSNRSALAYSMSRNSSLVT